jgi:MSHA biogenesis protein MshM
MYLEHFGLKEPPFSLTPDTHFWYDYESHHDALNVLTMALRSGEGFLKVTGEIGLGKTLICRKVLNSLGDGFVTAYIPNPHLSPASMRVALADELGLDVSGATTQEQLLRTITARLLELARAGKRVVLCLDEAQQLPDQTLEAVRLLTNLETEKHKLVQVVLFGQPELEQRLNQPHLRQLRQRITFSHELQPLTRRAVEEYVNHRLRIAGYRGAPLFTPQALDTIFAASRRPPRLVNVLAHKSLLAAFGPGHHQVTAAHARMAVDDTDHVRGAAPPKWRRPLIAGTAFAGLTGGVYLLARWLIENIP